MMIDNSNVLDDDGDEDEKMMCFTDLFLLFFLFVYNFVSPF